VIIQIFGGLIASNLCP